MGVRRNQRSLTAADRTAFAAAIKQMKSAGVYDWYVKTHLDAMRMHLHPPGGGMYMPHQTPAFLPWHRQFLVDFERDLQAADKALGGSGSLTLPYWDWLPDPGSTGSISSANAALIALVGGTGDTGTLRVTTGAFATGNPAGNWPVTVRDTGDPAYLARSFGQGVATLPAPADVAALDQLTTYDSPNWNRAVDPQQSYRNALEGWRSLPGSVSPPALHNRVHVWVGGLMGGGASPNDPIFFLHHANIDRLWGKWEGPHPGAYPDKATTTVPAQYSIDAPMPPWDGKHKDPHGKLLKAVTARQVLDPATLPYSYA